MGIFKTVIGADLKVLFRQYKLWITIPTICVMLGVMLHFIEVFHPAFFAVLSAMPLISLFERMFFRTENEVINYNFVPSAGSMLVVAKNASSMIIFLCITVPAVTVPGILLGHGTGYALEGLRQLLVIGLFMLLAGNIVSVRVVEKHITGISFRNGMIMGFSISIAVVLCQALSAFLGGWISVAICVTIFCVMYPFSSRETASSLQEATNGFLEAI